MAKLKEDDKELQP